jgi:hypothetical protein
MAKEQDHVADAALTDLLFDVTIYIYVDIVSEKWPKNWASKNMIEEEGNNGHADKRLNNNHKQ